MGLRPEITEAELDAVAGRIARAIVAVAECREPGAGRWKAFLAAFDAMPAAGCPDCSHGAGASAAPDYPAEAETADECAADLMRSEL